ncbi:hypothetical protein [Clostridiisalibacter paucivorans]|uniref:hypothetical protein n=1 Tax=Clostridiisalibacter paucivorans TaxID=408753 RepID=UPI00047BB4A6|nr:hypothetical protein [Clostridiisalibacter paucivorans]
MTTQMKGISIVALYIIGTIGITSGLVYFFHKKDVNSFFLKNILPIIVIALIVGATIVPYGLSYPDPVGAGFTVMFGIGLVIISIINVLIINSLLKSK